MGLLLRLAGRNILRQKRRTILTGMSIAGGYLLCALSFSMTEGSYNNAIRIFTGDRTGHIQIHDDDYLRRPRIHKTIDDMAAVAAVLDAEPHIQAYTTRVFAPALSYAGHNNAPTQVIGIDPVREKATSRLAQKIASGTWPTGDRDADGYYGALLGESIAATLEVGVGDEIILISQGADGSIANDLYRVAGTVGTRSSAERNNIYLPLHAAQEFLTLGTRVHEVAIVLDDITLAREEAAKLQGELPTLTVSPWQVVEETFYKSMQSDKAGNRVTLSIVVFIVFIGVLNTILMSVLERTREFGVLKAIGSRPGTVLL
ncbi:MAG: ABC transporter permease, partial [Pseudomonadales bacterium]|nr:ABC transporter permease [Pseudomonadales bacterium]